MKKRVFKISKDRKTIITMYDDNFELKHLGFTSNIKTKRASNVEMDDETGKWYIDLSPIGGGLIKGFEDRAKALATEVNIVNNWLATGRIVY